MGGGAKTVIESAVAAPLSTGRMRSCSKGSAKGSLDRLEAWSGAGELLRA